jgi:hypothetical protein
MTQIIGFAGKKQSGKDTSCNFILMLKMIELGVCKNARLNNDGKIEVSDVFGQRRDNEDYFEFSKKYVDVDRVLDAISSEVKIYYLADPLKRIAIDIFGLPEDKVYGTDDDKNEPTHLLWENMPGIYTKTDKGLLGLVTYHEPGPMTIREFLQYLGSDVFRKINSEVWLDTLFRRIKKDNSRLALVGDVRFDNEIEGCKSKEAMVLGLTKDKFKSADNHASENVNLDLCSKIIDNEKLNIAEQNKEIYFALKELGCDILPNLGV